MARVSVDGSNLLVEIEGLDKFWALKSRLVVPLAHVRAATADPGIGHRPKGVRAPGTYLPGVITAGTYRHGGQRDFWDIHHADRAVVIELVDERYRRLIIEVADPLATVALIEGAIPPMPPS